MLGLVSRAVTVHTRIGFKFHNMVNPKPLESTDYPAIFDEFIKESNAKLEDLRQQVQGFVTLMEEDYEQEMTKKIKEENKLLQEQVEKAKQQLINLQLDHGFFQQLFSSPGDGVKVDEKEFGAETQIKPSTSGESEDASSTSASSGKETKPAKTAKPKKAPAPVAEESADVGRLDIRVGKIINVKVHPDADTLYLEQIDVGEDVPRTIISGLVKNIPLAELDKRMVLVLCNLKPQKMRGILSEGMVMCACTPEKVELLTPPSEAKAGDKVTVPGYTRNPDLPFMNPKKKIFEKVAEDLKVDGNKVATYKNTPWEIEGKSGTITTQTLTGCYIK